MYKQIIAMNIILMCLFCISGCDTSEVVEFNDTNDFLIIKDIEYKELTKPAPQKKEEQNLIEKPVLEEFVPIESVSEKLQLQPIEEEDKTEIILQENFSENNSNNNYNDTNIYIDNNINTNGLTQEAGVNFYNGRTETYYSSNVLYHQDTDKWIVDDEGFYRTDEGYYVVAASDKEQGTIFEGSKGTCIVLDSGCEDGIDDYYVNWWHS